MLKTMKMLMRPSLLLYFVQSLALEQQESETQSNINNTDINNTKKDENSISRDFSSSKLAVNQYYDHVRQEAGLLGNVTRVEGEHVNLDRFFVEEEGEITLFHFGMIAACSEESYTWCFEDLANVQLALAHLNTGDGSVVPEVEGLNERCSVRFTGELRDSLYSAAEVVRQVFEMTNNRVPGVDRIPSAFIGEFYSYLAIPMALVTNLMGYPQISPGATSTELNDAENYPLFGRSVPSDIGNAVPVILFLTQSLHLEHLVIININDAYGNAYAEAMKRVAAIYAPSMKIRQIPLDEGQDSIESAIANVKESEYRFIFCLVFTVEVHDALMTEAYEQGVAGNGLHNWLFADSFWEVLGERSFEKGSALHLAYRGVGMIEVSGGVPGIPTYDNYWSKMQELRNPADFEYLSTLDVYYDSNANSSWFDDNNFLDQSYNGWAPFSYEATIAFGLAACSAQKENKNFTSEELYDQFLNVSFQGVSGHFSVLETGSRDSQTAVYLVENYREAEHIDEETGLVMVGWDMVTTSIFLDGKWQQKEEYIFNDGTSNIPVSIAPPQSENEVVNLTVAIVVPIVAVLLIGALIFVFYESKRKENDSVWKVDKKDIHYSDPPEVIGSGTFGLVLLAEYRGTQVAVKRPIPPRADMNRLGTSTVKSEDDEDVDLKNDGLFSGEGVEMRSSNLSGVKSYGASRSGAPFSSSMLGTGAKNSLKSWNKMKKDFVQEMRQLSKLRHPCITTIMGAITGNDPMLIMEYMEHGSLYDILHNETFALEGELLLPMLKDISQGMRYLHCAVPRIIHGDLKSANILVDSKFRAKVADFGLTHETVGGTPFWMAPELLRRESANTAASDVYSFGVILYEVYSRRDPYEDDDEDPNEILRLVADKAIKKRPPTPRNMPEKIHALMDDCVDDSCDNRPSFEEIDLRLKRIDAEKMITGENKNKRNAQVSLFDIFPRHIAEALRDGQEVEAEHKDCVTIFFSDIVGFTTISSDLDPRKVANMLDRLYREFDKLSTKYDIFKVETIGDAYMAVTNLVKEQPNDHAKRIAMFAIEAIQAANSTLVDLEDDAKGCVNIRVGFHSGSVVADVVGTRNPRYCLFGDTVNTASRMESNSKENRIHCSSAAAKLVNKQCPEIPLQCRCVIKVKGKGKMRTHWVNEKGRKSGEDDCEKSTEYIMPSFRDTNLTKKTFDSQSEDFASSDFLLKETSGELSVKEPIGVSCNGVSRGSRAFTLNNDLECGSCLDIEATQNPLAQNTALVKGAGACASFVENSIGEILTAKSSREDNIGF